MKTTAPTLNYREFNEEVLYGTDEIIKISARQIEYLKTKALGNKRRRVRLCTHNDVDDQIHEMIILHCSDAYVRPHKHMGKAETFHVIEGEAVVVVFSDDGEIKDVIPMGEARTGKYFYYKIKDPYYHTVLIHSDMLVFHEVTKGPFKREETLFAPWAPDDSDSRACAKFMADLNKKVKKYLSLKKDG